MLQIYGRLVDNVISLVNNQILLTTGQPPACNLRTNNLTCVSILTISIF
jgi:hypothetical protein